MYKKILTLTAAAMFIMGVSTARAGSVTIPNTFTSDTTAVAAEVNANFSVIDTAVDDNDSRIAALETLVARVEALEAALADKAAATHAHAQSDVTNLTTDLTAKADTSHAHAQSDVTNLITDLTAKADTSHAHAQSDVTDLAADLNTLTTNVTAIQGNSVLALDNKLILTTVNGYDTAMFTDVNVQVTNGSGSQSTINGLGNLIVGYNNARTSGDLVCSDGQYDNQIDCENAPKTWAQSHKSGSHNLVAGNQNSYSSYGGVVFGIYNAVNRYYAGVSGGIENTASGLYSSVSGGGFAVASGDVSSVSGGSRNTANNNYSSVSGGMLNTASEATSSVSGGESNTASGGSSSVSGGYHNEASGSHSSVSGGGGLNNGNIASNTGSSILGGQLQTTSGDYETDPVLP